MKFNRFGNTDMEVSALSFGASSLGGVFHDVDEEEAIATVNAALSAGINYFDVAPAYGGTRAETVLGKALEGVDRSAYYLSTKVGKQTDPDHYGRDSFDYSDHGIRESLQASLDRLGVDYVDVCYLHDIEYEGGKNIDWAIQEGVAAMRALKSEGVVRYFGFGIYPIELWQRLLHDVEFDAGLVHNHYCLNDSRLALLMPVAHEKGVGIVNASPFATGLLTDRGPADWHPANGEQREVVRRAADYCRERGTSISKLAFQFSSQSTAASTTMFSTANRRSLERSLDWYDAPYDPAILASVRHILEPVTDVDWAWT